MGDSWLYTTLVLLENCVSQKWPLVAAETPRKFPGGPILRRMGPVRVPRGFPGGSLSGSGQDLPVLPVNL